MAPLAAGLILAVASPVSAAPTGTAVTKMYQLPCDDAVCGAGDKVISAGSLVRGEIQIQISSKSSIGLSSLKLEANPGGSFVCWKSWALDGETSATRHFNWDTNVMPRACGDTEDGPGKNVRVSFRVIAAERASGDTHTSPVVSVRANNRPTTPEWASAPKAIDPEEGGPAVELRWNANPEADILEYHYVRVGPNNDEVEFAVSAANPGRQGCELNGSVYSCRDDAFGQKGFGGKHTYLLIAYRASQSDADSCALPPTTGCIQSETSETKAATLYEVPDDDTRVLSSGPGGGDAGGSGRSPSASRAPRPVPRGTNYAALAAGRYTVYGGYDPTLPYDSRELLSPPDDDQPPIYAAGPQDPVGAQLPNGRQLWVFMAAGAMVLVAAAHVARLARDPH